MAKKPTSKERGPGKKKSPWNIAPHKKDKSYNSAVKHSNKVSNDPQKNRELRDTGLSNAESEPKDSKL